jgi:hypothetical protein
VRAHSGQSGRRVGPEPGRVASRTRADPVEIRGRTRDVGVCRCHRSVDQSLAGRSASDVCNTFAERADFNLGEALLDMGEVDAYTKD